MKSAALKTFIVLLICGFSSAARDEEIPNISITAAPTANNLSKSVPTNPPNVQVTRTALHVARSLDPNSTETVQVRTRTGDIATLIVRKRGGKSNLAVPPPVAVSSSTLNIDDERVGKSNVPPPVFITSSAYYSQEDKGRKIAQDVINIIEPPKNLSPPESHQQQRNNPLEKSLRIPSPVNVRSSPMSIKGEQQQPKAFWNRNRSIMHIDSDGIPVIQGVRMPDDESDRQTWRNARVINGVLVPYESSDKQEITRNVTVQLEDPTAKKKYGEHSNLFNPSQYIVDAPKKHHYNSPYSSDTHARIIDYINTVNQRETERRSKSPNKVHMIRFPASRRSDEDKIEGRELRDSVSQGRVLQYPGSSIYPTSLLYTPPSQKTSRVLFEGVRTPVLQYAHPELGVQPARVMSKQDEEEKVEIDQQESQVTGGTKGKPLSLVYFGQDIHSDRSPYAYEPGTETNEEPADVSGTETGNYAKHSSKSDLSTEDNSYHLPKKPFAYLHQQSPEDTYGLGNDKYIKRFPYNGYNNVHSGRNKETFNRYKSMIGGSEYSRYPHSGHYSLHAQTYQERPFWERLSETIRDHVQTSMEKVSDITRPVVEPLVEATHKISHNLGFSSDGNRHVIQDKVGSAVAAYPVLLPALGLVAGGAALGLGAVAVGRYLDVDVMKRRVGEASEDLEVEHKRALEKIVQKLGKTNLPSEEGTWVVAEEFKNPDEQKRIIESAARSLSERQELSLQDEAQRKEMEEIVRALQEKYNNQQRHSSVKVAENVFKIIDDKSNRDPEAWDVGKNYSPSQDYKVQNTFGRQAVWSRVDDMQNQDEEEKVLEAIVRNLSDRERFNHGEGSSTENEGQKEREKSSMVTVKAVVENGRQIGTFNSNDAGIVLMVAEEPEGQYKKRVIIPKIDIGKVYVRSDSGLSQGIIDAFPSSGVRRYFDAVNVNPRVTLTFGEEAKNQQGSVLTHQHKLTKRSTDEDTITEEENRAKRYLDNVLNNLKNNQQEMLTNIDGFSGHHDWSNTPCAKKIFCDAMVNQPADAVLLMEKKMATFLSLVQPNEAVSYHLNDVMEAVKRHDCSAFACPRAVDASQVETPNRGPAPR